jgi:alpha-L-fucosidase
LKPPAFFDGPAAQLTDYVWQLQPKLVVTRGAMETPEQYTPGVALPGAWEGNLTMGTEWPWKATNEDYKSGNRALELRQRRGIKGRSTLGDHERKQYLVHACAGFEHRLRIGRR